MASAKRIIMNGNENTATDYIPYDPATGTEYWAYVNGVRIPHWIADNGHPKTKASDPTKEYQTGMSGGFTSNGYTYYCSSYNASGWIQYGPQKAFNGTLANTVGWATANNDTAPWIAIQLPYELKNIKVTITNRQRSSLVNGPIAGGIYGMDTATGTQTLLASFSGKDGATSMASFSVDCKNYNNAYKFVMIKVTSWSHDSSNKYLSIGEIEIDGKKAV